MLCASSAFFALQAEVTLQQAPTPSRTRAERATLEGLGLQQLNLGRLVELVVVQPHFWPSCGSTSRSVAPFYGKPRRTMYPLTVRSPATETRIVLSLLIRAMVLDREEVSVEAIPEANGFVFIVRVASGEVGKLIGKQGRTVRSLRDIVMAIGKQQGTTYTLRLVDE